MFELHLIFGNSFYSIMTHFTPGKFMYLKILWKKEHLFFGPNATFSLIYSKVLKT